MITEDLIVECFSLKANYAELVEQLPMGLEQQYVDNCLSQWKYARLTAHNDLKQNGPAVFSRQDLTGYPFVIAAADSGTSFTLTPVDAPPPGMRLA